MAIGEMHAGQNGATVCKLSPLLVKRTTLDIGAVDCTECLFSVVAQQIAAVDVALNRIRSVVNEMRALRVVEVKS